MFTAFTLEPNSAGLIGSRKAVADCLAAASVPVPDAERVILALSELATNAVQHGPPSKIGIEVDVEGDEIELRVKQGPAEGIIPHPDLWRLPADRSQITGRGLGIVAAVSDTVEVRDDGQALEVRARFIPRQTGPSAVE